MRHQDIQREAARDAGASVPWLSVVLPVYCGEQWVETTLESTIQTLRNTLEYVREQEQRERDERILLHRPRHQDLSVEPRVAEFPQEARR